MLLFVQNWRQKRLHYMRTQRRDSVCFFSAVNFKVIRVAIWAAKHPNLIAKLHWLTFDILSSAMKTAIRHHGLINAQKLMKKPKLLGVSFQTFFQTRHTEIADQLASISVETDLYLFNPVARVILANDYQSLPTFPFWEHSINNVPLPISELKFWNITFSSYLETILEY